MTNFMELLESMFKQGLGELPVFYKRVNGIYLGNMVYEKGHILFKDKGVLTGLEEHPEADAWEKNILGMVCYRELLEWKSLTFYGTGYCDLTTKIDPVLNGSLTTIKNEYGDRLVDFVGSIYRAYKLLLDNDFLPVVLLQQLNTHNGDPGLAIGDLRSISISSATQERVRQILEDAVDNRLTVQIDDISIAQ